MVSGSDLSEPTAFQCFNCRLTGLGLAKARDLNETKLLQSLTHLAIIWIAVFIANILARKTRLTPVLWFLFAGAALVNTGILSSKPDAFIKGMSELGILLIMFALGFEENTNNFITSIKQSWGIAFFGALAPFMAAYLVADYFWDNTSISLMVGLSMTATAVSLTMVSLKSMGLKRSHAATRIMTSAVLDDIASLALVAIVVPIASGAADIEPTHIAFIAGKAVLFFVIVTIMGMWFFPRHQDGWTRHIPLLHDYGMNNLLAFSRHSTLTVLLTALLVGLLAHWFGFHPAIGAYMAGLLLKEEYFKGKHIKGTYKETRHIVESAAMSWIGPIFFVELGSKLIFDWKIMSSVIPEIIVLLVCVVVAQVVSASLAARYTGAMNWPESIMVGFGMLGRAELAFVVMDIAYVQNSIIPSEVFYTLMATAFFLNILVPVTLALWKPYYTPETGKNPDPAAAKTD